MPTARPTQGVGDAPTTADVDSIEIVLGGPWKETTQRRFGVEEHAVR